VCEIEREREKEGGRDRERGSVYVCPVATVCTSLHMAWNTSAFAVAAFFAQTLAFELSLSALSGRRSDATSLLFRGCMPAALL